VFTNPNRCHAVTYFFYRVNKKQVIRFRLVGIQRNVADDAAPTNPDRVIRPNFTGNVAVMPQAVLATSKDRLEVERVARQAAVERERGVLGILGTELTANLAVSTAALRREPLGAETRADAMKAVDAELLKAGLIEKESGQPSKKIIADLSWEREEWLPTPGLLVKGCLDECETCEPALQKQIGLDLEHQKLRNQLLARQIELLDKAQEYRCCPEGGDEEEDDD
jgi:hypothetical protein